MQSSPISHHFFPFTYLLAHSMVEDIIWKADCHSSCQKNIPLSYGTRRFITWSQKLFETFRNHKNFYDEGLSAPRPTPSWRTTPCRLSATAYSIYSQLPSVAGGLPSIRNLGHAMPWWQGTHLTWTSSLLGWSILLSTLFSDTLNLCSSLHLTDEVSHPYNAVGESMSFYSLIFVFSARRQEDKTLWTEF
jgi:hypothetical protein